MAITSESSDTRCSKRKRVALWATAGVTALLGTSLIAGVVGCRHKGHFGHHRWGHRGEIENAAEARERSQRVANWVLDEIDADEAQRQQVLRIVSDSAEDLFAFAGRHRTNRDALLEAFSQTTIDREAVQSLRVDEMQLADAASGRLVEALVDVAEVLTIEQRSELIEHARKHRD